jgi:muramidase (phage lysozyme)
MTTQERAFLDMIAWAELGPDTIAKSDRGYNVLVGSLPDMVLTFSDFHRHPNTLIQIRDNLASTAAGRYQILGRIWRAYRVPLGLKGFWPEDQDKIALQLIRECKATGDIESGRIAAAIEKCCSRWASLPGAGYKQKERSLETLLRVYQEAGGEIRV